MFPNGSIPSHQSLQVLSDCELLHSGSCPEVLYSGGLGIVHSLRSPELYFQPTFLIWTPDPEI